VNLKRETTLRYIIQLHYYRLNSFIFIAIWFSLIQTKKSNAHGICECIFIYQVGVQSSVTTLIYSTIHNKSFTVACVWKELIVGDRLGLEYWK